VVVLLQNGKNKTEVAADMEIFLNEDAGSFANWLWRALEYIKKHGKVPTLGCSYL